jgi:16S rRNA (cytosine967-C5)-methyltransferase
MAGLADTQRQLLNALWPTLRSGGRLLYCTCSVFRAEGEDQVQAFLGNNSDSVFMPSPGHLLPGLAANGSAVSDNLSKEHDGFFYALLEKK